MAAKLAAHCDTLTIRTLVSLEQILTLQHNLNSWTKAAGSTASVKPVNLHFFDSTFAGPEMASLSVTAASGRKHCTKTHLSSQVDPSDSSANKFHKLHRHSFFISQKLPITALFFANCTKGPPHWR